MFYCPLPHPISVRKGWGYHCRVLVWLLAFFAKLNRFFPKKCIIIDTFSKYVWTYFLITKDEVFEILSDFCEYEIVKLRGRDKGNFKLFLMSELGEAHSNKIINLCSKHGIVKQLTAGYTSQVNAYAERYFRTNSEMAWCQKRNSGKMHVTMPTGFTTDCPQVY
jgi:transposase InsO family protein